MLWFIIGLLITIGIVIYWIVDDLFGWFGAIGMGFLVLLLATGSAVLLTIGSSIIAETCADKTYSLAEDIDIYALQDNLTTEGSFFLGSGHINDELKYFYVEQTEFGYTVNNVDADNTYIQYTTDRCHLERHTYTFDNWFVNLIAVPLTDRYVIYIPEGSIINNYSVDLK